MAIYSNAGEIILTVRNRPDATPPLVFPNMVVPTGKFAFSIIAKAIDLTIGVNIFTYHGTNGNRIELAMDGVHWAFRYYRAGILVTQQVANNILLDQWTAFYVVFDRVVISVFSGIEDNSGNRINLTETAGFGPLDTIDNFTFDRFEVRTTPNVAICAVKIWGANATNDEFQATLDVNQWDSNQNNGYTRPTVWDSPLRTPGDISNVTGVYTNTLWDRGHAYDSILPNSNFQIDTSDPIWMALNEPCTTWVYPLPTSPTAIQFNPGTTPTVPTIYKSTNFIKFDDRGSVPTNPTLLNAINYCAFPSHVGAGIAQNDSYPLYINEGNTEVPNFPSDASNRFENGTVLFNTITGLDTIDMYLWKFGGKFNWNPQPSPTPTATAQLTNIYLRVIYVGQPTGIPTPPPDSLVGLFVLDKGGKSVDKYNFDTELKIPNPTIRTALIGE